MQARLPSFKRSATRQSDQRYSMPKGRRYAITLKNDNIEGIMLMKYGSLD